jgi:hypothetical protein
LLLATTVFSLKPPLKLSVADGGTVMAAEERPKIEIVATSEDKTEPSPTSIFDDLAALRKKSKLTVVRKTVLVNVAVDKPPNNCYFRVNSDPEMMLDDATILRDVEGSKKTIYFVVPAMRGHPKLAPRLRWVTLALVSTWPTGNVILWPVPILGDSTLASWRSARTAFTLAQSQWVQIVWASERGDYQVEIAEDMDKEPVWPDKKLSELLKIAFADRLIDNEDHPYVRRLRGILEK